MVDVSPPLPLNQGVSFSISTFESVDTGTYFTALNSVYWLILVVPDGQEVNKSHGKSTSSSCQN